MRFYTRQHVHYCGIDLHARSLYLCILDQEGNTLVHRKLPCDRELLLKTLAPYREDLVVAVECPPDPGATRVAQSSPDPRERQQTSESPEIHKGVT